MPHHRSSAQATVSNPVPDQRTPLQFPMAIAFVRSLGMELLHMDAGRSEVALSVAPDHLNAWGVAHGGVLMTMLDVAMAMAARSVHASGHGVATVEMKTSFMRPAEGRLHAHGHLQHATSTLAFCQAELLDDAGQLCASATGTFKYLRALPSRTGVKTQDRTAAAADPSPQE